MIGGEKFCQCAAETAGEGDRHLKFAVAGRFSVDRLHFSRLIKDACLRCWPGYAEEGVDGGLVLEFPIVDLLRDDVFVA